MCIPASILPEGDPELQARVRSFATPFVHPPALMVALNDLRDFFQPKNSTIFSSLLKAKWRKQQGEEEGSGWNRLASERRGGNAGEQGGVEGGGRVAFLSQSKFAGKQTKPFPDPEPPVKGGI